MSDTTTDTTTARMFPALRLLERQLPPNHHGRRPYWRAPLAPITDQVYIPAWNWYTPHDVPTDAEFVTLDANAAYLSAIGQVTIGHCQLERIGAWDTLPDPRKVPPGYFRITVPHWAFAGTIVSPLGDSARLEEASSVWIAGPTLTLLLELLEDGHLGTLDILDSWCAAVPTNFRAWYSRLKSLRTEYMDRLEATHGDSRPEGCLCPACDRYGAFKEGYSAALSMMLTGEMCQTHRPDWSHTVYATHAANMWRKAWRFTYTGRPIISMGHVDEIRIMAADLHTALARPKPPFRLDNTGRAIGALKVKSVGRIIDEPQSADAVPLIEEDDDIL